MTFSGIDEHGPEHGVWRHIPGQGVDWADPRTKTEEEAVDIAVTKIRDYLDQETHVSPHPHAIPERVMKKWGRLFDIVLPSASRTCCFTRGKSSMHFP